MHFIRQLFTGSMEEWVHGFFTRYGRGVFNGPVLGVRRGKGVVKVDGSPEYCSSVGWILASSCQGVLNVSGSIYSKTDYRDAVRGLGVEFEDKTRKGYYTVNIKGVLDAGVLKGVYEAVPDGFILLSVKGERPWNLKSGKKPPKPGGEVKEGFFKASLGDAAVDLILDELLFDVEPGFREARVEHRYVIEDIIVLEGVENAAEARLRAKRKGRIERKTIVDGVEVEKAAALDV
jgi:hypothetical protein